MKPQYIINDKGQKVSVVLGIEEYEQLMHELGGNTFLLNEPAITIEDYRNKNKTQPVGIKTENILQEIRQLDFEDKLYILEKTLSLIKENSAGKKQVKLSSLKGLGSEIWENLDIDQYVENERKWD